MLDINMWASICKQIATKFNLWMTLQRLDVWEWKNAYGSHAHFAYELVHAVIR